MGNPEGIGPSQGASEEMDDLEMRGKPTNSYNPGRNAAEDREFLASLSKESRQKPEKPSLPKPKGDKLLDSYSERIEGQEQEQESGPDEEDEYYPNKVDRRDFLKIIGTAAVAGAAGAMVGGEISKKPLGGQTEKEPEKSRALRLKEIDPDIPDIKDIDRGPRVEDIDKDMVEFNIKFAKEYMRNSKKFDEQAIKKILEDKKLHAILKNPYAQNEDIVKYINENYSAN